MFLSRFAQHRQLHKQLLSVVSTGILLAGMLPMAQAQGGDDHWVGTWATSPMGFPNKGGSLGDDKGTTLREIEHISVGGSTVRVTLSNEFGVEPLTVNAASIAVRQSGSTVSGTVPLLFGGRPAVTIPAGALVVSDAAALTVKPLSDVAVSLFLPMQPQTLVTRHGFADQTNYRVSGDATSSAELTEAKTFTSWEYVKGIDVKGDAKSASVVLFGDSITDGALSTLDKNARWPDVLAARLAADKRTAKVGVLNEGIGGNRVLHDTTGPSALARFDRDVIAQTGVKYVVIMESINDIGHAADPDPKRRYDIITAQDLIVGFEQLARRAHTHGIKVYGATLTPYVGAKYQSDEGEAMRQAVNQWIRTSKDLDGVIDFDKVTTDPAHPGVYLPAYDSGDHLHPKDAGYKAMGESVDLKLFTK
ncbi:SGNH/GDSL hydrolase family protein [Granulicella paludicola]|uniref:SGNH/GDSL hydrolase family protein n=1 Tax=Granulicella paludicola TaxID=474951 RepID=UPI0021DFB96A|nr:SGNH/GDSL hydrolase family protein [Granulicella paludicola]